MTSRLIKLILAALLLSMAGIASADDWYDDGNYNAGSRQVIRCESHDQRTNYCDVDTRYGVRLVNQLSRGICIEGRTWGWDRRGIWVSGGCRAEFELSGYRDGYQDNGGYGRGKVVRCESRDQRTVYCNIDTRFGVRLVNQLSRGNCIEGRTWGWDGRGLWVSGGCRAEFEVGSNANGGYGNNGYDGYGYNGNGNNGYGNNGYGNNGYGNNGYGQRLTCESRDGRYNFCRSSTTHYIRQVEIRRQISSAACQYNYSWGYRSDGIWVDRGCRAEFNLY